MEQLTTNIIAIVTIGATIVIGVTVAALLFWGLAIVCDVFPIISDHVCATVKKYLEDRNRV